MGSFVKWPPSCERVASEITAQIDQLVQRLNDRGFVERPDIRAAHLGYLQSKGDADLIAVDAPRVSRYFVQDKGYEGMTVVAIEYPTSYSRTADIGIGLTSAKGHHTDMSLADYLANNGCAKALEAFLTPEDARARRASPQPHTLQIG